LYFLRLGTIRGKGKISEEAAGFPIINVYFPNVPTLVTGQVFAARKDTVMKIANPSSEVINLLLYAFRSPAAPDTCRGMMNSGRI